MKLVNIAVLKTVGTSLAGSSPARPMNHIHHLTPRYRGGSNDPENLIELTITQHAMFHYCNWVLWHNERDKIAWKALSGQISMDEAKHLAIKVGARESGRIMKEKMNDPELKEEWSHRTKSLWENPEYREKQIPRLLEQQLMASRLGNSPEAQRKRIETYKKIKHQQGSSNSQFGTMWITDGVTNKKVNKSDPIPEGFRRGRVLK